MHVVQRECSISHVAGWFWKSVNRKRFPSFHHSANFRSLSNGCRNPFLNNPQIRTNIGKNSWRIVFDRSQVNQHLESLPWLHSSEAANAENSIYFFRLELWSQYYFIISNSFRSLSVLLKLFDYHFGKGLHVRGAKLGRYGASWQFTGEILYGSRRCSCRISLGKNLALSYSKEKIRQKKNADLFEARNGERRQTIIMCFRQERGTPSLQKVVLSSICTYLNKETNSQSFWWPKLVCR